MPSTASKQPSGAPSTPVIRTPSKCGTGRVAASATTAGAAGGPTTTTASKPLSADAVHQRVRHTRSQRCGAPLVADGERRRTHGFGRSAGCGRNCRRAPRGRRRRCRVARATSSSSPTTTSWCHHRRAAGRCGCRRCRSGPSAGSARPGAAHPGVQPREVKRERVPRELAPGAKGVSNTLEHAPPVSPRREVKEAPGRGSR
jgi:hypothetical protein